MSLVFQHVPSGRTTKHIVSWAHACARLPPDISCRSRTERVICALDAWTRHVPVDGDHCPRSLQTCPGSVRVAHIGAHTRHAFSAECGRATRGGADLFTKCGRQSLRNTSTSCVSSTTSSACCRVSPNHCEDLRLPQCTAALGHRARAALQAPSITACNQ